MHSIFFWKSWSPTERFLFWLLGSVLVVLIVLFWRDYFSSPAPAITYEHFQQLQSIEVPSHSFSLGLINITVPAESYLIFENIFGSRLHPNVFGSYFFLSALITAFVVFISIATTLSRYRFLMSMGIAILFLVSLQFESIELFGLTEKTVSVALILIYGLLAFYLHAIKTETSFFFRLFVFLLLTVVVGVAIQFFAKVSSPFLHLSANGLFAGIAVCIIFIVMVSHEIVVAFVSIITQSLKSTKSLQHFLILTGIYLVNIFLIFASKMGIIEWSFFSVSPFFLIAISGVLGIWGFRQREPVHENILSDEPLRIYFFLSLALVAFGAMAYFASSASDMMMDALEDLIIAAHFGGGLIFALYVIANFAPMLRKNLPVHKILYKPDTMPHFTFRLMGIIATFAVLSWAVSWKTYLNQTIATYYNGQADVYLAKGDDASAEKMYHRSIQFRDQNLHAHYALANLYADKYESNKVRREYEKSVPFSPSVPSYLNLAHAYSEQRDLLQAALLIDEGKKKFPKSGELQNAAGLSFMKLRQRDSSLYYFVRAKNIKPTATIGESNLIAASAFFKTDQTIDSTVSLSQSNNNALVANQLALASLKNQKIAVDGKFTSDTSLNVYQAATLCNYLINQKENADTSLIRNAINLSRKETNDVFAEQLAIAAAHALYARGHIKKAMQLLREKGFASNEPKYFTLMGLWLLEQNNPVVAASYLKMAADKSERGALYYQTIAETEAGLLDQALMSCDSLKKKSDKNAIAFAEKLSKVLKAKTTEGFADDEKYFFCRYKIELMDKALFDKTVNEITDDQLRALAIFDRSKKWFTMDEPQEAKLLLNQLNTSYTRSNNQQVASLGLMIAAQENDWNYIQENISKTELSPSQKIYFEAMLAAQSGNQNLAAQKFNELTDLNNQFEEGTVATARFFANDTANQMTHFSTLVDGLLAKPTSIKILKQHSLVAADLGFIDASQDSLNKLRELLPDVLFKKFVDLHPDYFKAVKQ